MNYIISYTARDNQGNTLKSGKMRARNKGSRFEAMAGLEKHFKKTVNGFHKLEVHSCYEENNFINMFNEFSKGFYGK